MSFDFVLSGLRARAALRTALFGTALVAAFSFGALATTALASESPNVLLVTLDTTRADRLGAYGYEGASTPVFDALANGGTLFENAYSPAPLTLPAHATVLTGLEPPEHGLRINGKSRLPDDVPTLATTLGQAGYETGAFVAAFVLNRKFGLERGFGTYDDDLDGVLAQEVHEELSRYRPGNLVVDRALVWLDKVENSGRPFFAWVHLYDAHYPHHEHQVGSGETTPKTYDGEIAFADRQVGRIMQFLDARGLAENTLVVVAGDHGEGLNDHREFEHGVLLNEEVQRVPLVFALPGTVRDAHRVSAIVSLRDLYPTVVDLTGVGRAAMDPSPGGGRSLRPALEGGALVSIPSYAEADMPFTAFGWSPLRSITTDDWKYVRSARPELYDRNEDRGELFNLAAVHAERTAEMDAALAALESAMAVRDAAPAVALRADERERLEALGYLSDAGSEPAAAAPSDDWSSLRDIKDMLPTKHLATDLLRGISFGTLGPDEILAMSERLVRESPETMRFQSQLGQLYLERGRLEDAEKALREAARLAPDSAHAAVDLARVLMRQGKHVESREQFARALETGGDPVATQLAVATGHAALDQLDLALGHFAEAARLSPESVRPYLAMGEIFERLGRIPRALAAFEDATALDREHSTAHYDAARMLAMLGRNEDAVVRYRRVLELDPDNIDARNNMAVSLAAVGKADEAIAEYQATIARKPEFARAHFNLAMEYARAARFVEAVAAHERAVRLKPDWGQSLERYAWLLATCEDEGVRNGTRAVELATRAVELTKGNEALALSTLAAAQAEAGDPALAAATAAHALRVAERAQNAALADEIRQFRARYEERAAALAPVS